MLVIRFRAASKEAMKKQDCPLDCWAFPIHLNIEGPDNRRITAAYIVYLLAREGLNRVRAIGAKQLNLDGCERWHRWYDGKPFWKFDEKVTWDHPKGYVRKFNGASSRWFWSLNGHSSVWDTEAPVTYE